MYGGGEGRGTCLKVADLSSGAHIKGCHHPIGPCTYGGIAVVCNGKRGQVVGKVVGGDSMTGLQGCAVQEVKVVVGGDGSNATIGNGQNGEDVNIGSSRRTTASHLTIV